MEQNPNQIPSQDLGHESSSASAADSSASGILYVDIGTELKDVVRAYSNRTGIPYNFIAKSALRSYLRKMCANNEELEDVKAKLDEVLK